MRLHVISIGSIGGMIGRTVCSAVDNVTRIMLLGAQWVWNRNVKIWMLVSSIVTNVSFALRMTAELKMEYSLYRTESVFQIPHMLLEWASNTGCHRAARQQRWNNDNRFRMRIPAIDSFHWFFIEKNFNKEPPGIVGYHCGLIDRRSKTHCYISANNPPKQATQGSLRIIKVAVAGGSIMKSALDWVCWVFRRSL